MSYVRLFFCLYVCLSVCVVSLFVCLSVCLFFVQASTYQNSHILLLLHLSCLLLLNVIFALLRSFMYTCRSFLRSMEINVCLN